MCNPTNYMSSAGLKVPLTELNANGRQQFQSMLCDCSSTSPAPSATCIIPAGGTPTRPALQGTISYQASIAQKYPGSKTVIVLITDGDPVFGWLDPTGTYRTFYSCDDLTDGCETAGASRHVSLRAQSTENRQDIGRDPERSGQVHLHRGRRGSVRGTDVTNWQRHW